jgi:hypothetical protein
MFIYGRNFCPDPVVQLSTISLDVDSVDLSNPQRIVADLPNDLDPAGYRLSVDCSVDSRVKRPKARLFNSVFIGGDMVVAKSLQITGPIGLTGLTGPTGSPGATGATGATGVSLWERLPGLCNTIPDS